MFAQPYTRAAAVLVDELDAGRSRRRFFDETNVSTYIVQKTIIWVRSDELGQPITATAFNSTGAIKLLKDLTNFVSILKKYN